MLRHIVSTVIAGLLLGGWPAYGEPQDTRAQSPLAALPSEPGPHIAQIKALGDNSWLELGPPAHDPKWGRARGRSWTSEMPLAPELRGAFLQGEGRHGYTKPDGHYMDDLWFYDINAHRWICCYPGAQAKTLRLTLNADGFEATPDGDLIPVAQQVHGYEMNTYDVDGKRLMFMPNTHPYWQRAIPQREEWLKPPPADASPWFYETTTGKWSRVRTGTTGPPAGHGDTLIYLPGRNQALFLHRSDDVWFYSTETSKWRNVEAKGPTPPFGIDATSCYDSKRNRIYIGGGSYPVAPSDTNALWIYDLKNNTWLDPKPTGSPCKGSNSYPTKNAIMAYDPLNDKVLLVFHSCHDDTPERLGVYVYDPETNAWADEALAVPEKLGRNRQAKNGFYDPELNAVFIHSAGDSEDNSTIWVYRYRSAASTTSAPSNSSAPSLSSALKQGDTFTVGGRRCVLAKIDTLPYVESDYTKRFRFDAWDNPKLKALREKYRLDEVVAPGKDEFERQVLLLDWVNHRFKKFGAPTSDARGALDILEAIDAGHTFFCTHYAEVFVSAAASLGWVDRSLALRRPDNIGEGSTEHSSTEIWSNQHHKWVMFDPLFAMYVEKDGVPLNAFELRHEWFYRDGRDLLFVVDKDRKRYRKSDLPVLRGRYAGFGDLSLDASALNVYAFIDYIPNTNLMDGGPDYGRMFITKDRLCDGTKWHTRVAPADPATDPYFPINQAALSLVPDGDNLRVTLKTLTPNFKTYMARIDGGEWKPVGDTFIWSPVTADVRRPTSGTLSRLEVKPVNQFGVDGPVSTVEVQIARTIEIVILFESQHLGHNITDRGLHTVWCDGCSGRLVGSRDPFVIYWINNQIKSTPFRFREGRKYTVWFTGELRNGVMGYHGKCIDIGQVLRVEEE